MKRYDPLAPLRPRAQRRLARTYVSAQIMPLLAQLNKEFSTRARAGEQAIGGYTSELARQLAPMAGQTHDIYAAAQQQQQGVNTALANRIAAAGGQVGGEVGAKLAQAGIPSGVNNLAQIGSGAAAASSGIGSAALASLIARGAAAENYSASLPGIARLGGLQRAKQYAAQLESERAQQAGELRSKIPGLTQQVLADIRNQEFQKAAANLSYGGDVLSYKARAASTAESARSHNLSYKARMAAITAANERTGMTLRERARQNRISNAQQAKVDAETARHHRVTERIQRYRAKHSGSGGKGKKGGPPSMNR